MQYLALMEKNEQTRALTRLKAVPLSQHLHSEEACFNQGICPSKCWKTTDQSYLWTYVCDNEDEKSWEKEFYL